MKNSNDINSETFENSKFFKHFKKVAEEHGAKDGKIDGGGELVLIGEELVNNGVLVKNTLL